MCVDVARYLPMPKWSLRSNFCSVTRNSWMVHSDGARLATRWSTNSPSSPARAWLYCSIVSSVTNTVRMLGCSARPKLSISLFGVFTTNTSKVFGDCSMAAAALGSLTQVISAPDAATRKTLTSGRGLRPATSRQTTFITMNLFPSYYRAAFAFLPIIKLILNKLNLFAALSGPTQNFNKST